VFVSAAKDLRRLRRIIGIVVKYGYGERLGRSSVKAEVEAEVGAQPKIDAPAGPKRFRMMLEELGPTFIKLGQVLSARPDLVSAPYVEELKHLQAECTPLSFGEIRAAIQSGLGSDPDELFDKIEPVPLATASVAQVHKAVTKSGAPVVVKVQRPGIREEIGSDVDILYRIAQLLEAVIEESAIADPVAVVREFEEAISSELNFEHEAANIREFARLHQAREDMVIPAVHNDLSSSTVLTLDFLDGSPFTRLPPDADRRKIAERILQEGFEEIFIDGFFHGDPHPGNLLLLKDGRYGILDFGLCGRLTPQMRETLVVLSLAVALKDADTAARTLYRLGQPDQRVNISALRDELQALFHKFLGRPLEDVQATLVLQELMSLAIRHKIRVPPEYTLLGRACATIEGIIREFAPELDISKVATPYAERLLLGRVGGDQLQGGLYRAMLQLQGLSQDVPIQASQILSDLAAGNFSVTVKGPPIDKLTSTLLVATTAVSLSILGGSFVIGSFIALSRVEWSILGVPVFGIVGAMLGALIFSWVNAYVFLRPRLKKISLTDMLGKKR
jgi:ubiquinone biosynthesis protein